MEKTDKLAFGDIENVVSAHETYSKLSEQISERMQYILHFCVETVKGKVSWWDWENGGDGGDRAPGDFIHSYSKHTPDTLQIAGEWTHGSKMTFLDKNGDELDLEWGEFPTRWLYEDFEEEYKEGLKRYKAKLEETTDKRKINAKKRKEERDALIASAKQKLTPAEIKAMRVK